MRGNELCKIFTENIKLRPKKAEIKIPWLKDKKSKEWSTVNIFCSCFAKKLDANAGGRREARDNDDPILRLGAGSAAHFVSLRLSPSPESG